MGRDDLPQAAETMGLPRIVSIQNAYNLVNRAFEVGLAEIFYRGAVSLFAYSPLGQGYLTGKYEGGALPQGSRKLLFDRLGRYEMGNGPRAISAYVALARKHGLDPAQMAIAFAISRPFVTSTIIGATSLDQLKTDIDGGLIKLSELCSRTSRSFTSPTPILALEATDRNMPRLFSGIEIPSPVARRLTLVRAGLTGARWIDPENYHLTLRFLGDVDGTSARDFTHSLGDIAASPFELKLVRLASFGGRKPRAIFASVSPRNALTFAATGA